MFKAAASDLQALRLGATAGFPLRQTHLEITVSSPSLPRGFPMKTCPHYPQQPALITGSSQNKQLLLGTLHLFSCRSHSNVPTKNQKISVTYWLFLDKERATVCLVKKFQFLFFLHRHKARHFYTIFDWRCVYNNIYNICNKL